MLLKEKEQIIDWLEKYKIKKYSLVPNHTYGYVVAVGRSVVLNSKNLTDLCVKFGVVSGDFDCGHNNLTSLEGAPETVQGYFSCSHNQLTSLIDCPQNIGDDFYCNNNQLNSLEGCPDTVEGGGFYCDYNSELGELQDITEFKTIQTYLLAKKLANDLNMKNNKKKVKL